MKGGVELIVECGIDDVQGRLRVFLLTKDYSAINIMQKVVKVVRLVGESAVVVEDIP